ncbi:uncharacterized protein N7443_005858 [Penicillium atrosanguineum]|uniref:uncharacterized protein n=1 Tax=Penicillium atrosanguineum TaxID=1132637 RepID=UPI0023990217|nr:uncharacterized protein N7443_005858 [Penicillium atrosanguineum]KAJ5300856.1 hypothetical protein N7443_005858 [Penicillium atrosanguineum]
MPSTDEHRDISSGNRSPLYRHDVESSRRAAGTAAPSSGRPSGELEGSTLGSGSREGDSRTPGQRRAPSSSGFLLDSLPRSKGSRVSSNHHRPSEPPTDKRTAPEADIVVPKKRSRFPWHRHKNAASEASAASASGLAVTQKTPTPPPVILTTSRASSGADTGGRSVETPGLDRDSIQIVNLALNLNESRRRTASGLAPGSSIRRPISVSQPTAGPTDLHASSSQNHAHHFRNYDQRHGDRLSPPTPQGGHSPVAEFLPATAVDNNRAYEFSSHTLARAEQARCHFDLFHEYLRLLPLLPPLRTPQTADDHESSHHAAVSSSTSREYNPLQMIRNRRVRYREKCPIDPKMQGWHDVDKVHDWVTSIEAKYGHKTHEQTQSIKLPPFQQGQRTQSHDDPDDLDILATSPSSSSRRASRTNSVKAPRPRLDWKTSPAELLADAAWLEDVVNKAKIIDKDSNPLYPNPEELVLTLTKSETAAQSRRHLTVEMEDEGEVSPRASMSGNRPALGPEFKSVGRGRHRNRFRSHSQSIRGRSESSSRKRSRWDKVRMRSGSASSDSSAERRTSVEPNRRIWAHSRKDSERSKDGANSSESRVSRAKSPTAAVLGADKGKSNHSHFPSLSTQTSLKKKRGSFSSAGSMDDRYNSRMSFEERDSTAPNSPAHTTYFPSIAVNLSPPSSRSPSPAKKGLRRKIASRHERSKSKQGDRELKGTEDALPETKPLPRQSLNSPPERAEQALKSSKLEPSPLPDVVSSSYIEDQDAPDDERIDGSRGRRVQNSAESKLRGILKGPGRIAELVGNEVSKVGDKILKKDAPPDSRKSSSATTLASDDSDSDDEEKKTDKRSAAKGLLRRLPNLGDEPGRLTRRESEKATPSKSFISSLPSFTSPLRQDERNDSTDALYFGSPRERATASLGQGDDPKRTELSRSRTFDFTSASQLNRGRTKPHAIRDPSVPFSLTRPPVTGLAKVRASPQRPIDKRPTLSGATRAWSISGRSIQASNDSGVPSKTEIERTRILLLSSGIKAREITRRAHSVRDPPPHWLQASIGSGTSVNRVPRINEFDLAAQNLLRRFETTQYSFQQSMHHFTTTTSSPLRTQLKDLETLINQSLAPRVRATADHAEDLCVQLNTTSTLAVKSLGDALDRGVRKRRRRLRWVRRAGFVILEWALVGMLWWVWLIVMGFKLVRGVLRGAVSGARWFLWL